MPTTATTFVRLYRKVQADGGTPAEPGPAYTGGEYVALTAFGLWKVRPTDAQWYSGVVGGERRHRARLWRQRPKPRMAEIRFTESSSTRSIFRTATPTALTLTEDSRFVRSFTTGGPGAWKRIVDGTDGWVDLVTNVAAHHQTNLNSLLVNVLPGDGFDATYFEEIEIEVASYGQWNPEGHQGVVGNFTATCRTTGHQLDTLAVRGRPGMPELMESRSSLGTQDTRRGSYKVRDRTISKGLERGAVVTTT